MQWLLKGTPLFVWLVSLTGCVSVPDNVTPVANFELQRYLGKWYEIARLDHSFERGLSHVSAEYVPRDDGGVDVINRGFNAEAGTFKQAQGRAYFVDPSAEDGSQSGYLKVSFFGPFYSSYLIFELDQDEYQYAFVSGYSHDYVWLLARAPVVDESLRQRFIKSIKNIGFDSDGLIWVDQVSDIGDGK